MFNAIVLRAAFFLFEDWMMPSVLDVMRDDLFIRRPDAATEFDDRTRMRRLNPTTFLCNDLFMQQLVYATTCLCDERTRQPNSTTENATTECDDLLMR